LDWILTSNNTKNICFVITNFSILDDNVVKEYRCLLNELYPNNNSYFLTANIGDVPFITKDHINIINRESNLFQSNEDIDGGTYNHHLIDLFSKYLSYVKHSKPEV
jgi:hypothetical protein